MGLLWENIWDIYINVGLVPCRSGFVMNISTLLASTYTLHVKDGSQLLQVLLWKFMTYLSVSKIFLIWSLNFYPWVTLTQTWVSHFWPTRHDTNSLTCLSVTIRIFFKWAILTSLSVDRIASRWFWPASWQQISLDKWDYSNWVILKTMNKWNAYCYHANICFTCHLWHFTDIIVTSVHKHIIGKEVFLHSHSILLWGSNCRNMSQYLT